MADVFLKVLNMSISASWIVLAVLVLRFLFKRAPKWLHCMLWGIVGLRLLLPFSIESVFSLIPSAETISKTPNSPRPHFESGISIVDNQVNDYLKGTYFEGVSKPTGNFVDITTTLSFIWLIGIFVLCIYTMFSYLQLKHKVATAVILRKNIYQSENVVSPFVLGIIKPKIYLPFHLSKQDITHVIAHEKAHIRRKDHWWKPLGFLLLTLHWFNPLMWLGYVLLCRDIELACDEKVIKELNTEQTADYAQALLTCSVNRRIIAACPLAFGELGVKNRVQSVLNYRKPSFWMILLAGGISIAALVCFLTNPISSSDKILNKLTNLEEYKVMEQDIQKITLSIPVSTLPNDIFTEEGYVFNETDVIGYEDSTTTIYLKKAQLANEGTEYLYFCFDFTFRLPKEQGSLLYPYKITNNGFSTSVATADGILRTDTIEFKNAIDDRGQGPNEQIWFYISTEAVRQAEGTISFDIYLNQITYSFDGANTTNAILQEPPKLIVLSNETSIEALKSTYSWIYQNENGRSTAIMADGSHPVALKESLPLLKFMPAASSDADSLYAVLQFNEAPNEVVPDEIIVHAYAAEDIEMEKTIEITMENGIISIPLEDGNYIYEVIATWNSSEKYSGTVHYGFRAVKTD